LPAIAILAIDFIFHCHLPMMDPIAILAIDLPQSRFSRLISYSIVIYAKKSS
jgi:hypothetical protein